MERIEDHIEDALIDLGAVAEETKGQQAEIPEFSLDRVKTGLTAD